MAVRRAMSRTNRVGIWVGDRPMRNCIRRVLSHLVCTGTTGADCPAGYEQTSDPLLDILLLQHLFGQLFAAGY